ncbi:MAG: hypothetical protein ACREMB_19645 [Candidatus Rokuibacteriota bacterium]
MASKVRWTLAAMGVLMLVGGSGSIFWTPADEILYAAAGPRGACGSHGCLGLYTLELGNTGGEVQPDVRVRLRQAVLDSAVLPPKARDYGKFDRPVGVTRDGQTVTYALGEIGPEVRVELSFVLRRDTREALPGWDDVLVAVEPARGRALPGSAPFVILLRIWYSIARVF